MDSKLHRYLWPEFNVASKKQNSWPGNYMQNDVIMFRTFLTTSYMLPKLDEGSSLPFSDRDFTNALLLGKNNSLSFVCQLLWIILNMKLNNRCGWYGIWHLNGERKLVWRRHLRHWINPRSQERHIELGSSLAKWGHPLCRVSRL